MDKDDDVAQGHLRDHEAGQPVRPEAAVRWRPAAASYAGANATILPYDPAKANQLLDAAGYKKGADGKRTKPDGCPLAVNFSVQAGFIDYQAIADVVADGLNDVGFDTKVTASAPESVDEQKKTGDFQMLLDYLRRLRPRPQPRREAVQQAVPDASSDIMANVERFSDPRPTQDGRRPLDQTTDKAEQKELSSASWSTS